MVASIPLLTVSLFRHGDRTYLPQPDTIDPDDEEIQAFISRYGGYGMLTDEGLRQHAKLGAAMKKRYLADEPHYNRTFIHVRSSCIERCLRSVQSQLNVMFPNEPVPIHTVSKEKEYMMRGYASGVCPKMHNFLFEEENTLKGDHQLVSEAHGFTQKLNCGTKENPLQCSLTEIEEIKEKSYKEWEKSMSVPQMHNLAGAALFGELIRMFEATSQGRKWHNETSFDESFDIHRLDDPKLILWSAHDTTLMVVHSILKTWNQMKGLPPYASSIQFELNPDNCITIWWNHDLDDLFSEDKKLHFGVPCLTIEKFKERIGDEINFSSLHVLQDRCSLHETFNFTSIHLVVIFMLFLIIIIIVIASTTKKKI